MREDEIMEIWQSAQPVGAVELDMGQLGEELDNKANQMDRNIRRRDRREVIASYVGMVIFGVMAWHIPWLLSKVACLIAIAWFAFVIYRLQQTRRKGEPDITLPFREQLKKRVLYVKEQARLLRTVFYWYILPPYAMNALFILGIGDVNAWDSPLASWLPDTLPGKVFILVFLAAFYGYIVWVNRHTARTYYDPAVKELEQVLAQLDEKPS
ncbi:MAG: hypothetical protein AAFQ98_01855 [Bacteroidota bacterium]